MLSSNVWDSPATKTYPAKKLCSARVRNTWCRKKHTFRLAHVLFTYPCSECHLLTAYFAFWTPWLKKGVVFACPAITKYHKLSGLSTIKMYFLQFWRMRNQRSRGWLIWVSDACSLPGCRWLPSCCVITWSKEWASFLASSFFNF